MDVRICSSVLNIHNPLCHQKFNVIYIHCCNVIFSLLFNCRNQLFYVLSYFRTFQFSSIFNQKCKMLPKFRKWSQLFTNYISLFLSMLSNGSLNFWHHLINCTLCYGSKYYFIHKCCLDCDAVFKVQLMVRIACAYWRNYKTRSND